MIAPRLQFAHRMCCEEIRTAAPARDLPRCRLSAFLAELERMRLRWLGPRTAHTRNPVWFVLMQEDARAAEWNALMREASADRVHRAPATSRMSVSFKFPGRFHRDFTPAECSPCTNNPALTAGFPPSRPTRM